MNDRRHGVPSALAVTTFFYAMFIIYTMVAIDYIIPFIPFVGT